MANEIENMFMNKHLQAQLAEDEYIIEKVPEMLNVDNRTTALSPQFAGTGSHLRDQMLQMEQEQALTDNSLMFTPVGRAKTLMPKKPAPKVYPKSPYKSLGDVKKAYPGNPKKLMSDKRHKEMWVERELNKYGKSHRPKPKNKVTTYQAVNALSEVLSDPKVAVPSSLYFNAGMDDK